MKKGFELCMIKLVHMRFVNVWCLSRKCWIRALLGVECQFLSGWKPSVTETLNHYSLIELELYYFSWLTESLLINVGMSAGELVSGGVGGGGGRVTGGMSEWGNEIPAWLVHPRARHINEWAELARHSGIIERAHTHTTIAPSFARSAVQEGFNLLLLSHRAWHSVERSLFRESIHSKIKLVPSAPSPIASRHKADDYQLEPAQLQQSTGASEPATKISTYWIWKLLTSCRLPVVQLGFL